MKKLLTITLSLILSCSFAQWEWQNPLPQGNSIEALSFIDENNGWAVGWGTIMNTTDGGITWNVKDSNFGEWYYDLMLTDVCFTDAMNGWIVGGMPGFMFHTADGGQTWSALPPESTRLPSAKTDVFFISNQIGWVLGWAASIDSVYIQCTLDGGDSWDSYTVCSLPSTYNGSMYFVDDLNGWVAWGGNIMHTIDGGITWEHQINDYTIRLNDIYFTDADHGWAVGRDGLVLNTTDGGENWELLEDTTISYIDIRTVLFKDNYIGWIGGFANTTEQNSGQIYKTTDGGNTWTNQLVYPLKNAIYDIKFNGDQNIIAAGSYGEILKNNIGSDSWTKISSSFTNCNFEDVFFADENHGWAAGGIIPSVYLLPTPAIFYTNNGGINWIEQNVPIDGPGNYSKIFFTDNKHGWAIGLNMILFSNKLISTVDGGETWEEQLNSYDELQDFYFVNNSIGWVVGYNGVIHKTEDGGWNWTDQQSGTERNLNSVIFIDEEIGWIAGDSIVLKTENGGNTWQEQSTLQTFWNQIFFFDELHGWVVSRGWGSGSGISMRTIDGGISWEEINAGFLEVYFTDAENGWSRSVTYPTGGAASPPAYNMWTTNDGGLTWEIQHTPVLIEGGFYFVDESNGWAVSKNGTILHTDNGGASNIFETHIQQFTLTVNTHPNPFKTSTTLSYTLKQPTFVQLSIFNQLGQLVYHHSEEQQQGEQKLQWVAKGLSEGVYYYRLKVGDAVANGKLIKVN